MYNEPGGKQRLSSPPLTKTYLDCRALVALADKFNGRAAKDAGDQARVCDNDLRITMNKSVLVDPCCGLAFDDPAAIESLTGQAKGKDEVARGQPRVKIQESAISRNHRPERRHPQPAEELEQREYGCDRREAAGALPEFDGRSRTATAVGSDQRAVIGGKEASPARSLPESHSQIAPKRKRQRVA